MKYDLVVIGGTPSGIAASIRASILGLSVIIVENRRLGGLLSGGLATLDVQYEGHRAPIYDDFCERILNYYADRYGLDSPQYANVAPRAEWPLTFEPHVAERVILEMLSETAVDVLAARPLGVDRSGRLINAVRVLSANGDQVFVEGSTFVDATYEGDLFAFSGEPYAVGRESREEFGEPHAGRLFTRRVNTEDGLGAWPQAAARGELALRAFKSVTMEVFAGSTGEGDSRVQAYNFRLCLSCDPDNRVEVSRPVSYDPEVYRAVYDGRGVGEPNMPNGKRFWWRNLVGPNWRYPEATEAERDAIRMEYRSHALGFLYFLQHDETVEPKIRAEARLWGLARDEYVDNENVPYELYIREARRLRGRYVFTEHDASVARGLDRTPIHADSIAFTDWFMDSHQVDDVHQAGSSGDGEVLLTELTRPAQIPYASMLPVGLDNLLVTVCMSSTHVGWGALRLEPVFMHVGEVAGYAAALAKNSEGQVGKLDVRSLQSLLVAQRIAPSFFNDVDISEPGQAALAVHFLSTFGFFASFDARLHAPLHRAVAQEWIRAIGLSTRDDFDPTDAARRVGAAEREDDHPVDADGFLRLMHAAVSLGSLPTECLGAAEEALSEWAETPALTRGQACQAIFTALRSPLALAPRP